MGPIKRYLKQKGKRHEYTRARHNPKNEDKVTTATNILRTYKTLTKLRTEIIDKGKKPKAELTEAINFLQHETKIIIPDITKLHKTNFEIRPLITVDNEYAHIMDRLLDLKTESLIRISLGLKIIKAKGSKSARVEELINYVYDLKEPPTPDSFIQMIRGNWPEIEYQAQLKVARTPRSLALINKLNLEELREYMELQLSTILFATIGKTNFNSREQRHIMEHISKLIDEKYSIKSSDKSPY